MGLKNNNEAGFAIYSAIALLSLLGFITATTVEVVSADSGSTANLINKTRANFTAHAGLEYATYRLSNGLSPTATNKDFGDGQFTVTSTLMGKAWQLASTGTYADAKTVQTYTPKMAVDCVDFGDRIAGQSQPVVELDGIFFMGGWVYYDMKIKNLKVKFDNTQEGCSYMKNVWIKRIVMSDLSGSQEIVQVYYDGTDASGTAGSDDYFNRYGKDYERDQTIVPAVNAPTPATAYPERANVIDIKIDDSAVHNFNRIFVAFDEGYATGPDVPQAGDSFNVSFDFSDGSSYNVDVVYN